MSCCDVNGLNRVFRGPLVRREQQRFKRRGLNARQRGLLPAEAVTATVLDLGCGVGGLGLSALAQGAERATFVEVSRAYLAAARELAESYQLLDRSSFLLGDALELELEPHALVLLDRVVCCHPSGPDLLHKAAALSQQDLRFSYPWPSWYLRLGHGLVNAALSLFGHPYRSYLHDEAELSAAAASAGHRLVRRRRYGVWQVCHYRKPGVEQSRP